MNDKEAAIIENNPPKIMFISHGGPQCGMGHVVRSLSLALAFYNKGCSINFYSNYKEGIDTIKKSGYTVYSHDYDLYSAVSNVMPDIIIIDTYDVSIEMFKRLSEHAFTVYIDDLYSMDYPVDVVLNGNITGLNMGYKSSYEEQLLLLGMQYNLIRREFIDMPKHVIHKNSSNIMITTGASDPFNMTYWFLKILLDAEFTKNLTYNVVIGSGFTHQDELFKTFDSFSNIKFYIQPEKISDIMLTSDIAISAGGSTLYELMACGTPTLAFIYADNQRTVVEYMSDKYIINLGYYKDIKSLTVLNNLRLLILDYEYRRNISVLMQELSDGKGSTRAACDILNHFTKKRRNI